MCACGMLCDDCVYDLTITLFIHFLFEWDGNMSVRLSPPDFIWMNTVSIFVPLLKTYKTWKERHGNFEVRSDFFFLQVFKNYNLVSRVRDSPSSMSYIVCLQIYKRSFTSLFSNSNRSNNDFVGNHVRDRNADEMIVVIYADLQEGAGGRIWAFWRLG